MTGLPDYHAFIRDLGEELERIEDALAHSHAPGTPCTPGCSDCCRPMSVLPLEACAIAQDPGPLREEAAAAQESCPFLTETRRCRIYAARPFLCRTRGFPILFMNGDGEWQSSACGKRGFPSLSTLPGIRLELWNARLFQLNESFCRSRGIASGRIRLSELPRHLALFSPA